MRFASLAIAAFLTFPLHADVVRLGTDVVPKGERVELRTDPRGDSYSGSVFVDLDVKKPVSSFRLHANGIEIASAKVNGKSAKFESGEQAILVITPARPLKKGPATLQIDFTNEYNKQAVGLYKMAKDGEPYLFTQFEAIDARKAFPVWDEPGFKLPYELTVTAPAQYVVVSNTPVANESTEGEWRKTRFARTRPLPAYLVALAVGQFDVVPIEGMSVPGQIYTPKGQGKLTKLAAQMTPPIVAALEKYFGSRYPFEKVGLIAVPEYWYGAMENPGAITYRDAILLIDEKTATPGQKRNLARVTAHELAHMWFGDLVTMKWWDDFWLNESFADWMGDKITDTVFPEFHQQTAELQSIQGVMSLDARPSTDAIRKGSVDPEEAMRTVGIAYDKGKAVLGMFENFIGPDKFRQGVLDHLKANAWGNATSADFWRALAKNAPAGTVEALESFIDQPGIPLVAVTVSGPNEITLTQKRFASAGVEVKPQLWRIPVTLHYSDGTTTRTIPVLLDAASKTVKLEGERLDWIHPDADARGYYRWQIPDVQMTVLASRASSVLSARERLALIGNLGALLRGGAIHGNTYLETLARLAGDTDPQVITSVMSALGGVRASFVTRETEKAFAALVRRTFGPALERFGYTPKPGESPDVAILRPGLIAWMADSGQDERAMAFAREQAAKFRKDPTSVDASLAGVVLFLDATQGDEALFDEYRQRFENAKTPSDRGRFLGALSAFRNPAIRTRALDYTLAGPLRAQEIFTIPFGGEDTPEERDRRFAWVTTNYDFIASKLPTQFLGSLPFIAGGCEPERLARAREFFATHKVEGTEKQLERVAEQVNECMALRSREMAAVAAYLWETAQ